MEIRTSTELLKFLRQSPIKIRILCSALVAVLYPEVFESLNRRIEIAAEAQYHNYGKNLLLKLDCETLINLALEQLL